MGYEYMFGEDLLVAPVHQPVRQPANTTDAVRIWIPPGTWYEWQQLTANANTGPVVIQRQFALSETPVFVRQGAVIPTKSAADAHNVVPTVGGNILLIFPFPPSGGATTGYLYADAGTRTDYGTFEQYSLTMFDHYMASTAAGDATLITLDIAPNVAGAGFASQPQFQDYQLRFMGLDGDAEQYAVTVNGQSVAFALENSMPPWSFLQVELSGPWSQKQSVQIVVSQ